MGLAVLVLVSVVSWPGGASAGQGREAPTLIACLYKNKREPSEFRYRSRPSRCDFFARQYFPDGKLRRFRDIGSKHMKWTDWGGPIAVGVGKSELAVPLTVKAFDRVHCPDGRWYYGKVFTHSTVGRDQHLRLAVCGERRFPPFRASGSSVGARPPRPVGIRSW